MSIRRISTIVAGLGLLAAVPAWAGSTNASMSVSATVAGTCSSFSAAALTFGAYTTAGTSATGALTLQCSNFTVVNITTDDGLHFHDDFRHMKHSVVLDELGYVFTRPGDTIAGGVFWQNLPAGSATTYTHTANGTSETLNFQAAMPPGQTVGAQGLYEDTMVFTANF